MATTAAPVDTTVAAPAAAVEASVPTTVYALIHAMHASVSEEVDSILAWGELQNPAVQFSVVKPFVERFAPKPVKDEVEENASNSLGAVIFALMANRLEYAALAEKDLSQSNLQNTRAMFCEYAAIKILRAWPDTQDEEELTAELVRNFGALDGAPEDILKAVDADELAEGRDSALELAIISDAKHFCSQPLIQHLAGDIYSGKIVYHPPSTNSFISDNYVSPKTRRRRDQQRSPSRRGSVDSDFDADAAEVYSYNPYLAGWLDYTRLRVPRWRQLLEFLSFFGLVVLFVLVLANRELQTFTFIEGLFIAYSLGIILDEFAAAKESGWLVYFANAWNVLDVSFVGLFFAYIAIRIPSLWYHSTKQADLAFDTLSLAGCILFPRLVFFFINSSVVILALRGMISTYVSFMALTAVAFSGIAVCLWELARGNNDTPNWTFKQIIKLLFQIWFGSATWTRGSEFHPMFGPILLFTFSLLCKSFIVVILMGMVSAKYSRVYSNASEEYLFQRIVTTVEGVKSDAVFSYIPPFNLLALAILMPIKYVGSAETLHRVNVFLIRACNFPILFAISAYERYAYRTSRRAIRLTERGQVKEAKSGFFGSILGSGSESLIHAAFDLAPPPATPAEPAAAAGAVPSSSTAPAGTDVEAAAAAIVAPAKKPAAARESLARLFRDGSKNANTVTVTAEEWNEVRASQKRLEDMLEKVMAVTGAGK